ncbi:MAG: hypothetical protein AB9888_07700 [Bacteroidales bacterium]
MIQDQDGYCCCHRRSPSEHGGSLLDHSPYGLGSDLCNWSRGILQGSVNHGAAQDDRPGRAIPRRLPDQTEILWNIRRQYPNGGDLDLSAPFEKTLIADPAGIASSDEKFMPAAGAAVYLRHTWGEKVPSFYVDPQPDRTAYAWTWIYSPSDQKAGIHFSTHNYGRSELDMAPPEGEWDFKRSRIWLNGELILPPAWS